MDDLVMDLDLNHEPVEPSSGTVLGLGSLLNDLQTAHSRIEERILQLEAIAQRAWRRHRLLQARNSSDAGNDSVERRINVVNEMQNRNYFDNGNVSVDRTVDVENEMQNPSSFENGSVSVDRTIDVDNEMQNPSSFENGSVSVDRTVDVDNEMQVDNSEGIEGMMERCVGREEGCKRDSSHLVGKALEMDLVVKKVGKDGGSFFDCNICLGMAREPILTCCGHLYCWACFYQLPDVDLTTKECPVCKGEVRGTNFTPIYGNGRDYCSTEKESDLEIPPRPKAHRVESVRQQRVTRGSSPIRVAEAVRQILTSIGLGDQQQQHETGGVNLNFMSRSQELQNADVRGSRRLPSRLFSRIISDTAASLSSELDNAQRMFADLAASLTDSLHQSNAQNLPVGHGAIDEANSFRRDAAAVQSEYQTLDAIAETLSAAPVPSSSQANEVSDAVPQLENLTTNSGNLPLSPSSVISRRRSAFLRLSDVDTELLRDHRRRRLS